MEIITFNFKKYIVFLSKDDLKAFYVKCFIGIKRWKIILNPK